MRENLAQVEVQLHPQPSRPIPWGHPPIDQLRQEATTLRRDIVQALHRAGGGHYGGALSVLEMLLVLYRRFLCIRDDAGRQERDRLILSKGHAAIALYAVLNRVGLSDLPLSTYAVMDSGLEGHPDMTCHSRVDFSTGSLGQGLSVGVGMALGRRDTDSRVWVLLGDGECQEGQVWEAAMLASQMRLARLHAVVDCNGFQEWGWTGADGTGAPAQDPVPLLRAKWESFGWMVLEARGNDVADLSEVFARACAVEDRPSVVLAHTTKGNGVPMFERDPVRSHCLDLTEEEYQCCLRTLR